MEIHNNNLICLLEGCVSDSPERVSFISSEKEIKTGEIWNSVCNLSAKLSAMGIVRGSRVVLMLSNSPEYVISYFAILYTGAIVVPVNVMLRERELRFILEDCEARAVIADKDCAEDVIAAAGNMPTLNHVVIKGDSVSQGTIRLSDLIEEPSDSIPVTDVSEDDTAVILYTSGHTGTPKGAELRHCSLIRNAHAGVNLLQVRSTDRIIGVLPFSHAFGQTTVMNTAIAACATVILLPEFDAEEVLRIIEKYKITLFLGTPSMYRLMLAASEKEMHNVSSLRFCVSGGSALEPELLKAFEEHFSTTILEGYGLSETTAVSTFNHTHRDRRPGSIGTPIEAVDIKLVDDAGEEVSVGEVGEIIIKTDYLMKGYLHRPEATRTVIIEGWFYTGDMARVDDDGYYYIVDRKNDMIVKGGFNVYPVEIEKFLLSHPAIKEAAVIGVPDHILGEEVKACIVINSGMTLTAEELDQYCRQRMARYKCPRYIQFFQRLPKNSLGRISNRQLREMSNSHSRK